MFTFCSSVLRGLIHMRAGRRSLIRITVVTLIFGLLAGLNPSIASAAENVPVETLCDDLGLLGCDGSVPLNAPIASSSSLGSTGLGLSPTGSGGLSGGISFEGPRGGPAGLGLTWDGSGDGLTGVGFGLAGVSRIDRCAQTPLLNNTFGGDMRYELPIADATWCLGGIQLEDVSGDASEYRAMVENGVIVRREGGADWDDPDAHFVVYARNGTVTRFDHRIGGTVVFGFLPTQITDASSNSTNYQWSVESGVEFASGIVWTEQRLSGVTWGGNTAANTPDEYAAHLLYEPRPHPIEAFAAGVKFLTSNRLSDVTIRRRIPTSVPNYFNFEGIRQYQLNYHADTGFDPRSYLSSLVVCERPPTNTTSPWSLCTEPTTFEWDGVKADAEAFEATPDVARWESAPNDGDLRSPYEVGQFGPLRHFQVSNSGTVDFAWRSNSGSIFPELDLGGPVGTNALTFRASFGGLYASVDVHRFATDRAYFHTETECADRSLTYDSPMYVVCGARLFSTGNYCDGIGQFAPIDTVGWPESQLDACLGTQPTYIKNTQFDKIADAFGAQMTTLLSSSRLLGDFDCDGINDDWVEPNMFGGPSTTSFGAGTALGFDSTYDIATGWSLIGVQFGPRKFWNRMGEYVRSLAEAYSGLVVADFNGDCYGDIYQMKGESWASDRIYLGDGSGGFVETNGPVTWLEHSGGLFSTEEKKMKIRASDKSRLRFGHFNNDRLLDVAYVRGYMTRFDAPTQNRLPISVFLNGGDGTWDEIKDGPELVVRKPLELSSFSTPNALALTNRDIGSVQIGNMNADGCADLFVLPRPNEKNSPSNAKARVYYSHCDGSFDLRHPGSVNLPLELFFEGHQRDDGRQLGAFQIQQDEDGDLPDEVQMLWQHDIAETASVRLFDMNGDGLDDIYKIHEGSRDEVWLNLAGTDFVRMDALDYQTIGDFPTDQAGNTHPDVSWDIDSQLDFDISRFLPIAVATGALPGMWIGGQLSIDTDDAWHVGPERFYSSAFEQPRLRSFSDGLGNTVRFEWSIHRENNDPLGYSFVVTAAETTTPATAGGGAPTTVTNRTEYSYSGLSVDPRFGSLGWATVASEQVSPPGDGRRRTETTFWQDDQRTAGTPKRVREFVASGGSWVLISESTNRVAIDWLDDAGFGSRDPLAYRVVPDPDCTAGWGVAKTWRLDGVLASETCTTSSTPDIWGNVDWTLVTQADGSSVETRYKFLGANSGTDDATMRYRGLASSEETIITGWDGQAQSSVRWTAWNLTHLSPTAITVPGDGGQQLYTHYAYNTQGNVATKKSGGSDIDEVVETFTFTDGTIPRTVTKVIGGVTHTTETVFDDLTIESPTTVIDANGVAFWSEYDEAGRLRATGGEGTQQTNYVYGVSPTFKEQLWLGGLWADWEIPEARPASYTVYDRTGRPVRTAQASAIGWSVTDTYYDERGANTETSLPYIAGPLGPTNRDHLDVISSYDALGRPTLVLTASGNTIETTHEASLPSGAGYGPYYDSYPTSLITTTATTLDGVTSWATVDGAGRVIAVTNPLGNQWFTNYDASGNSVAETDPDDNEILWEYDVWGRLVSSIDPDFGTATATYDAVGNMTGTVDNIGNRTEMTYDGLGRMLTAIITDETGAVFDTTTYTYDTKPNGIGSLATQTSDHETVVYSYTSLSQLETIERTIEVNGQSHSTSVTAHYDALGRNYRSQIDDKFFDNIYDDNTGEVIAVTDPNTGDEYWRAGGYDDFGRLALSSQGNGTAQRIVSESSTDLPINIDTHSPDGTVARSYDYEWDQRGNLEQRRWSNAKGNELFEVFTYDMLDRLATSEVLGQPLVTRGYTPTNNLGSKSDYSGTQPYRYDELGGAGPNTPSGVGNRSFRYDGNGNLIGESLRVKTKSALEGKQPVADERAPDRGIDKTPVKAPTPGPTLETFETIVVSDNIWTPHNRIESSTRWDAAGDVLAELDVAYGVEGIKVHQTVLDHAADVSTQTWYLAGNHRLIDADGQLQRQIDVPGPAGVIATITIEESSGFADLVYRHVDHLGSPVHYSDASGDIVEDVAYGPDGAARSSDDWSDLAFGETGDNPLEDAWGGHDGLELFGFTNLGARLYDQHRGQFIQPDTLSGELRYGYGDNNSLSHVDPDGHYAAALHFLGNFAFNSLASHFGVAYGLNSNFGADGGVSSFGTGGAPAVAGGAAPSAATAAQAGPTSNAARVRCRVGNLRPDHGGFVAFDRGDAAVVLADRNRSRPDKRDTDDSHLRHDDRRQAVPRSNEGEQQSLRAHRHARRQARD